MEDKALQGPLPWPDPSPTPRGHTVSLGSGVTPDNPSRESRTGEGVRRAQERLAQGQAR